MIRRKMIGNDSGMIMILALLLIVMLTLLGLAANRNVVTNTLITSSHRSSVRAFYAADGGAQYGFNGLWQQLQNLYPNTGSITPPTITGINFTSGSYISTVGSVSTRTTTGNFAGLTAYVQRYRIQSVATDTTNNAVGKVIMDVEDQLIPLFQFGIFYQNDLELGPGANMTFSGGKIHSNNNIYLTAASGATLSIDSMVTSAGSMFESDKAGRSSQTGTVRLQDNNSVYQTMNIDSTSANWATDSQTKWGGEVKDMANGITPLNVPLPSGGQAIDLLGTGTASLDAKAGLKIINGTAQDSNGNVVDITYYDPNYKNTNGTLKIDPGATAAKNVNPITTGSSNPTFYDGREQKTMTAVEIDITKLQHSTTAMNALNNPSSGGDAGILYVSSSSITNPAVRLVNGSALNSASLPHGLSVATNNPLYVKGNYNTNNAPAALYADAVTVLSGNWSDTNSNQDIGHRTATATTVNAAIMAGNKDTSGSNYSGGVENFMRFLENWSGVTLTYSGSLVCLWQSVQATHNWPGTGSVYNPPTRNWSYGMSYNNLPPGTPRVRNIMKLGWRQATN